MGKTMRHIPLGGEGERDEFDGVVSADTGDEYVEP